jgi:drug/metabolite transporter (DMT)-like permease
VTDTRAGRRRELTGAALAAASAAQFAIVVILGRQIQGDGPPFVFLALRFGLQSLVLFAALLLLRRPMMPARGERLALAIGGGVGYASESALAFLALNHGKAGPVTLIFYTYPVLVLLATVVLERRAPQPRAVLALALSVGGAVVVIVGGGNVEIAAAGIALALCSAAMFTFYLLSVDRWVRRTDPLTSAAWLGTWACVGNATFALASGATTLPSADDLPKLFGVALASAGAFAAMFGSLRRIGPVRTSIISVLEPVVIALLATVFLDQALVGWTAVGGLMIVAGAVTATLVRAPRPEPLV